MFRYLRIAVCSLCILAGVALVALWIRSYETADELNGWLGPQRFTLGSREGRAVVAAVVPNGVADAGWYWHVRGTNTGDKSGIFNTDNTRTHYSVADLFFAPGDLQRQSTSLGFGIIHRSCYFVWNPQVIAPGGRGKGLVASPNRTMYGSGLIVPYWFLVLLTGVLFAVVRLKGKWRYSIRSLLIAVTFLSILLGLVVTVDRITDPDEFEPVFPAAPAGR